MFSLLCATGPASCWEKLSGAFCFVFRKLAQRPITARRGCPTSNRHGVWPVNVQSQGSVASQCPIMAEFNHRPLRCVNWSRPECIPCSPESIDDVYSISISTVSIAENIHHPTRWTRRCWRSWGLNRRRRMGMRWRRWRRWGWKNRRTRRRRRRRWG